MSDPQDVPAVIAAAEHAASTGDLAAAESLLLVALNVQEAQLGRQHPDVASTLNNLAVVCEMANKPDEAERFYRRASDLTLSALGPTHPLTVRSRDNLHAFRLARDIPPEWLQADHVRPAAAPASPSPRAEVPDAPAEPVAALLPPTPIAAAPAPAAPALAVPATVAPPIAPPATAMAPAPPRTTVRAAVQGPVATSSASKRGMRGALGAAALALVVVFVWWSSGSGDRAPESEGSGATADAPVALDAPAGASSNSGAAMPSASAPSESPRPAPEAVPQATAGAASNVPPANDARAPADASVANSVRVIEARICSTLTTGGGRWRCTPPDNPAAPGRVSFYTRIAAPRSLRVHHRWFRGDSLQQDVTLSVGANPGTGYRTFSRQVIDAVPGAQWRVELRTSDGHLLHEERIFVR